MIGRNDEVLDLPIWQVFLYESRERERVSMAVCYKKLWKLLIDKDLMKKDLCRISGISTATVTKMGKGGYVSTEVLEKICKGLECKVEEIIEVNE